MTHALNLDYDAVANLPTLFFDQADRYGDAPFLWAKRDKQWVSQSWREVSIQVARLAAGLKARGVNKGDRVVIVSENRPEWMIADLAIMAVGAIMAPCYATNTVQDHTHILSDSGAVAAFVSNEALAKRLLPAAANTGVRQVFAFDAFTPTTDHGVQVTPMATLLQEGAALGEVETIRDTAKDIPRDALSCIIYTSGTGGAPAGVMLSHGALICNAKGAEDLLHNLPGFAIGKEIFLSFLPLSHAYEHTVGQFVPISIGAQVYYSEGIDKLIQNIEEVRPTIMTAVPRLYESIRGRILRGAEQAGGLKEKLLHKTVDIGRRRYLDPNALSLGDRLLDPILDKLVRKKVSMRFGGRLKAFVSGGAPLNQDVGRFFTALGVKVLQGYGLTESAPVVACNIPTKNKLHTVGPPLCDVEVKIADDGEILIKGELVMMGYWGQPDRTAQSVKDGWLHTGDIGNLDEDGYVQITDRKKDIIVNSGGDNVSPQKVEGVICLEPEILQAMVYGDKRPHLVSVIVPDPDWTADWRAANDIDEEDLASNEAYRKALQDALERVNKNLSVIERVRRFTIANEAFTTDNAMLTPSMKIRRHVIRETYGEDLEALYG